MPRERIWAFVITFLVTAAATCSGILLFHHSTSIEAALPLGNGIETSSEWGTFTDARRRYSFEYPSNWTVTSTSWGATRIENTSHVSTSATNGIEITILSLGKPFGCARDSLNSSTCFSALSDLVQAAGYRTYIPRKTVAYEALQATDPTLNAVHVFIRVGDMAYDCMYGPASSTSVTIYDALLSSLHFN
jgi:hypothetical protein